MASPFNPRVLPWLIGISALSLVGGVLLAIFAPNLAPVSTVTPSGYSRSALGHQALVQVLEELGVPVVMSRNRSAKKVGPGGMLVVAEPRLDQEAPLADGESGTQRLQAMLERAPATLLVLPKWEGRADVRAPAWIREATLVDRETVQAVLDAAGVDAQVVRHEIAEAPADGFDGTETEPLFFSPLLQLVEGPDIVPVIRAPEGVLVAEVRGRASPLLILSDPDPLSNAGLYRGPNARFALDLIDRLRTRDGAVVFDETLHGFEASPSIWHELASFPLVLVPLHLLLVFGLLLWATLGRFGAPQKPPPALEPGTAFLVSSTADLLRHGTSAPRALARYMKVARRQVATALNAPASLDGEALDTWLDRVAKRRGVDLRLADLRAAVLHAEGRPSRVRAAAQEVHRWREEILHGSVHRPNAA